MTLELVAASKAWLKARRAKIACQLQLTEQVASQIYECGDAIAELKRLNALIARQESGGPLIDELKYVSDGDDETQEADTEETKMRDQNLV